MSDEDFNLAVPFTACHSQGGPYADLSFTAGFQVGQIDARLRQAATIGANHLVETVYHDLLDQLDLIAMHHGYTVDSASGDTEWLTVSFLLDVEPLETA